MIELFKDKKNCCGCAACMNACPKEAIAMEADEDGFIYPTINYDICVDCGLCQKVCAFQNVPLSGDEPLAAYAAINKSRSVLLDSTSGGLFGALASLTYENNGVVFGCDFNENLEPEHICIANPNDIRKLQGSKYVQSSINTTFSEANKYLEQDRAVLFTGTPCQIAGLKSYLGKDYKNLITADLICHGVPSAAFFKGYIKYLEGKLSGKIIDFKFRDKSRGWRHVGKAVYLKDGVNYEVAIAPIKSYYYNYFAKGDIYRETCYKCKYAGGSRQGDFTMGDYWGIEKAHPEIDTRHGVSVLLVNSEKGMGLLEKLSSYLVLTPSTYSKARANNGQLNHPMHRSLKREGILKNWREGGCEAVAVEYTVTTKDKVVSLIKDILPHSMKKALRSITSR